jgi:CDP-diacylglycerol--serine O-phosphatidyltransferase
MNRIIKAIPDCLTLCNLLCGCIATVCALGGDLKTATYWIFAAALFDFLDGFAARLLKATSLIGLQLDSLSDVVSFGVAPSSIVYCMLAVSQPADLPSFIPFVAYLVAAFSALRLAKFNIDQRQTHSFIGLPTPACALFICGLAYFDPTSTTDYAVLLAMVATLCFLLVCNLPMFSLKIGKSDSGFLKTYRLQLLTLLAGAIFLFIWQLKGLVPAIALYVVLSIFDSLNNIFLKR